MPENRDLLVLASVRAWIQISEGRKKKKPLNPRLPVFTIHPKGEAHDRLWDAQGPEVAEGT